MRMILTAALMLFAGVSAAEEPALTISDEDWDNEAIFVPQSIGDDFIEALPFGYPRWEPIAQFAAQSRLRAAGEPVGRLKVRRPSGLMSLCTAFFVSADLVMTNNHCVPGANGATEVRLELGLVNQFDNDPFEVFHLEKEPVVTSVDLDFTLLRLEAGQSNLWGWVRTADLGLTPGQPLYIYHHPNGEPMRVSREGCFAGPVRRNLRPGYFVHQCDTLGGSSGAPIFNEDYEVIGIHHRGTRDSGYDAFNQGTIFSLIRPLATPHMVGVEAGVRVEYARCLALAYDSGDIEGILDCVDLLPGAE